MKNQRHKQAVSQIISEIILLAIAIVSVSIIYTQALAVPEPQDIPNVTVVGKIEEGQPVFDLQRGESLGQNTKVYISIAGKYNRSVYTLNQVFLQNLIGEKWNIGEKIILPLEDIPTYKGPRVEGTIVDIETNAIVFWGVLQEGLVTTHKGGIWHFDEPFWNKTPEEVIDSSGNRNHGTSQGEATTVTDAAHQRSGYFDGYNDSVRVETSWALNISDAITVEAWMKPDLSNFIFDSTTIDIDFGYLPHIVHVIGDYYALVSEDKQKLGMIQTVRISPDGKNIEKVDNVTFGAATADQLLRPFVIKMNENLYLIGFNNDTDTNSNNSLQMELRTFNISQYGYIEYTSHSICFTDYPCSNNPGDPNRPSLQKISNNTCAIAYWSPSYGGILRTVNVSSEGEITDTNNIIRFDSSLSLLGKQQCRDPCLVQVKDDIYAIAYYNVTNENGDLKTFRITTVGKIIGPLDEVQFETESGYEPSLIHIEEENFALAYRNDTNYGCIKTYTISSLGDIEWTGEKAVFAGAKNDYCFNPCITHDVDEYFVVAYSTGSSGNSQGYVVTIQIWQNGSITVLEDSKEVFEITKCFNPIILTISKHLFAICYTGPVSHPGYLTIIFYGIESRGIYKGDSFMLSCTAHMVKGSTKEALLAYEGGINHIRLYYNASSRLPVVWHHVAMTYDGTTIRLYVDGICQSEKNYTNDGIRITSDDLHFGQYYVGYLDEIAIYDVALTETQLKNHITSPGAFLWYAFN